jgi:hypothetical protein
LPPLSATIKCKKIAKKYAMLFHTFKRVDKHEAMMTTPSPIIREV